MKIINVSDEPYEWTFNSQNYGPIKPGEIWEGEDEIARHALKRSAIVDELGEVAGWRCEALGALSKERIKELAAYPCPWTLSNQCSADPFKNIDDLRKHMDLHWGMVAIPQPSEDIVAALSNMQKPKAASATK